MNVREQFFTPASYIDHFLSYYRYSRVFKTLATNTHIQSALDLGCGSGSLIKRLKQSGIQAMGLDVAEGDDIIAADLNKPLPIETESMDLVTSLANLEHLNEPLFNLKEIHRVLKKNGICILTTPSTAAKPVLEFLAFRMKLIDRREIEDHKTYFSKKKLGDAFQEAGFSQVNVKYFQLGLNLHAIATK